MTALLLVVAMLGNFPRDDHGMPPPVARRHVQSGGAAAPYTACSALNSTDKSSTYGCLNGDQTTDGTVVFSAVGSPAITAGTTCSSAAYTTIAANSSYFVSQSLTTPTGDFTACAIVAASSLTATYAIVSASTSNGSAYPYDTEGDPSKITVYANTAFLFNTPPALALNTKTLVCFVYTSSNTTVTFYVGSAHATSAGIGGALQSITGKYAIGTDAPPGGGGLNGKVFGGWVIYRAATFSDVQRWENKTVNCL